MEVVIVNDTILHIPQSGSDEVGKNNVHCTTHRNPDFIN